MFFTYMDFYKISLLYYNPFFPMFHYVGNKVKGRILKRM